jgi:hypothetical protein
MPRGQDYQVREIVLSADNEEHVTGPEVDTAPATRIARTSALGLADQAVSSAGTFLLGVLVARVSTPSQFGDFSLVLIAFSVMLEAGRAALGEPLLGQASSPPRRVVVLWAAIVGALGGLILGALGVGLGQNSSVTFVVALSMPGLLALDGLRYSAFARGKPGEALFIDSAWLLLFACTVPFFARSVFGLTAAWCASAVAALCLVSWKRSTAATGPTHAYTILSFVRANRIQIRQFVLEFAVRTIIFQGSMAAIAVVAGPQSLGKFRLAWLAVNPLNIVLLAVLPTFIPYGVGRIKAGKAPAILRFGVKLGCGLALLAVAWALLLALAPGRWGAALLGPSWQGVIGIAVILSIGRAVLARASVLSTLVCSPTTSAALLLGAVVDGARGAAIGLFLGELVAVLATWRIMLLALPQSLGVPELLSPLYSRASTIATVRVLSTNPARSVRRDSGIGSGRYRSQAAVPPRFTKVRYNAASSVDNRSISFANSGRFLSWWMAAAIVSQRIGYFPGETGVPLGIGILAFGALGGSFLGHLAVNKRRLGFAILLLSGATLATIVAGSDASLPSFGVLAVVILSTCVSANGAASAVLANYVRLMTVVASLAIFQFMGQLVGLPFIDPLGFIPRPFAVKGFVSTYSISYTGSLLKTNGFVFLEASFLSQALAIAIIIELIGSRRRRLVGLLVLALFMSFSATGWLLLGVGLVAMCFRRGSRRIAIASAVILGAAVVGTSAFSSLIDRGRSQGRSTSSLNLRFVLPYTRILFPLFDEPSNSALVFGHGAGQTSQAPGNVNSDAGKSLIQEPPLVKISYEYGLTLGVFVSIYLLGLARRVGTLVLALPMASQAVLIQNSLFNPAIMVVLVVFSAVGSGRSKPTMNVSKPSASGRS